MTDNMTASEALFGFVGWLTTRNKVTTMSSNHDCVEVVDRVAEFCAVNNLEEPREGWHKSLVHPK